MMEAHQPASAIVRGSLVPIGNSREIRFELTEELGEGGTADAKVIRWDPTDEEYEVTTHTVTVADFLSIFSGQSGDRGYARWWPDRQVYEIYLMECPA